MSSNVTVRLTALCVFVAFVLCCTRAALAQELVDNPQYKTWAKHNPGTRVTISMKTSAGGQSQTMTVTQTLVEVKPEAAVVEMKAEMEMNGQKFSPPAQKMPVEAKVPKEQADMAWMGPEARGTMKEVGAETITVNGKDYKCKVMEYTGEAQGTKGQGKAWVNDDVPGMLVKNEMTFEGQASGTLSMELVSVEEK